MSPLLELKAEKSIYERALKSDIHIGLVLRYSKWIKEIEWELNELNRGFEEGQECFYNEVFGDYYETLEEAFAAAMEQGWTKEECEEANEDLTIYYTMYAE